MLKIMRIQMCRVPVPTSNPGACVKDPVDPHGGTAGPLRSRNRGLPLRYGKKSFLAPILPRFFIIILP